MTTLAGQALQDLLTKGWMCDDYGKLCPNPSHRGKKHRLLYDPENILDEKAITKSCYRYTSLSLHAGDVTPSSVYRKKLTRTKEGKDTFPWRRDRIVIPSGRFVFMLTRECVDVPLDVEGELYMGPRVSNLGLLFFTLGHVHSGFHGRLTATLLNMTDRDITLEPDQAFLHLVCHKTTNPVPPHPAHDNPQLTLGEAQANLYFNKNPGFALTTKDFATKEELRFLFAISATLAIALFSAAIAVMLYLLRLPPVK